MSEVIKKIVIVGAGLMGASIAQSFPEYGIETVIYSKSTNDFDRARKIIANGQKTLVENKVLRQEESDRIQSAIVYTVDKECFGDADWIIEAIPENLELKQSLFGTISGYAKKNAIITSNTSAISIDALSEFVENPERFCGTHWLNPAHIIPLVEITKGIKTSQETADAIYQILTFIKKQPVMLKKDVKGFLSNRLQFALLREATYLVEQGVADPEDIDKTIKYGNGLRYTCSGPFKIADLGGLTVFNAVAKYLYADLADEKKDNHLLEKLVEEGNNGISTGKGFYQYQELDLENEEKERDTMILGILRNRN